MAGGKVHGGGGKKKHAGIETLKKLLAVERARLRIWRQMQRRQRKQEEKIIRVMKNTKMFNQLNNWAKQELIAVFSKIRKKGQQARIILSCLLLTAFWLKNCRQE